MHLKYTDDLERKVVIGLVFLFRIFKKSYWTVVVNYIPFNGDESHKNLDLLKDM